MSTPDDSSLASTEVHKLGSFNRRKARRIATPSSPTEEIHKHLVREISGRSTSTPSSDPTDSSSEPANKCAWSTCLHSHQQEYMLHCTSCGRYCHAFCCDPPLDVRLVRRYSDGAHWRCQDCSTCAVCSSNFATDNTMVVCVDCSRRFHPKCGGVSQEEATIMLPCDRWQCKDCKTCAQCGDPLIAGNTRVIAIGRICQSCVHNTIDGDEGGSGSPGPKKPGVIRIHRNCAAI